MQQVVVIYHVQLSVLWFRIPVLGLTVYFLHRGNLIDESRFDGLFKVFISEV